MLAPLIFAASRTDPTLLESFVAGLVNAFAVLGFFISFFSGLLGALVIVLGRPTSTLADQVAYGAAVGFLIGFFPFIATLLVAVNVLSAPD